MLNDSWPLLLSGFVIMIYMRSDQIMIAQMLGNRDVGIYSAAVKLSEMWYFIPIAINKSIAPSIIKVRRQDIQKYYVRLSQLSNYMIVLAYSASIMITIFSAQIVQIMYGPDYGAASVILSLHVWGGCFIVLGLVRSTYTTTENLTHIAFISTAVGAAINIVLNYFMIGKFGTMGAAVATLVAQASASYFNSLLFSQTRKLFLIQTKALFLADMPKILRENIFR